MLLFFPRGLKPVEEWKKSYERNHKSKNNFQYYFLIYFNVWNSNVSPVFFDCTIELYSTAFSNIQPAHTVLSGSCPSWDPCPSRDQPLSLISPKLHSSLLHLPQNLGVGTVGVLEPRTGRPELNLGMISGREGPLPHGMASIIHAGDGKGSVACESGEPWYCTIKIFVCVCRRLSFTNCTCSYCMYSIIFFTYIHPLFRDSGKGHWSQLDCN